jgi:hypothetical protein
LTAAQRPWADSVELTLVELRPTAAAWCLFFLAGHAGYRHNGSMIVDDYLAWEQSFGMRGKL